LLLLSGEQRQVCSSIFGFTSDQTLVSCVPAINKHEEKCIGEEKDQKPDITMHGTAIKSGLDALEKHVRE
jgi:hypothetical protein